MSNFSDHKKPHTSIVEYLPEVYRSDINRSVFTTSFDRQFTKDDATRVAGFIGKGNPSALIDRQIKESTPHRQAYQLAPTMYTKVGTVESALSFSAFRAQLELMGVDMNRYPDWGSTTQFNWVPPINIDMLVNYANYFWAPFNNRDSAQYMTIESRCNKLRSKAAAYANILKQRGHTFPVSGYNFPLNEFHIPGKIDDLFESGFVFFTKQSANIALQNKFWTVDSSTYDVDTNTSQVKVIEPIAYKSATPPGSPDIGDWWYNTVSGALLEWTGSWTQAYNILVVTISLDELGSVYQGDANCACEQGYGWDIGQWDDNQIGNIVWNTSLITSISSSTAPLAPAALDLWYNTTTDKLNQRSVDNTTWKHVVNNFSAILAKTTGKSRWDSTIGCEPQQMNQWSSQNQWIHQTEVTSFTGIRRAALPILEYNSNVELNEWVEDTFGWKYRVGTGDTFIATNAVPTRIELEPIKGFKIVNVSGRWYVYLFDKNETPTPDVNYADIFIPGYQFRIADDGVLSDVYTVDTVDFRESTVSDPVEVQGNYMVTVVRIVELSLSSTATSGGGINNIRIEPTQTSLGDSWRGYHVHWVIDTSNVTTAPVASQSWTLRRRQSVDIAGTQVGTPEGTLFVGVSHQELTVGASGVSHVPIHSTFLYSPTVTKPFIHPGDSNIRVYLNGIRQYGNYVQTIQNGTPSYTVIGHTSWNLSTLKYVTGITFSAPLNIKDVVRIEIGPAAQSDAGMYAIPVRTIEDEDTFILSVASGVEPQYQSLVKFRQVEQVKTSVNQYPMFNVYDVVTGDVVKASNIFGYAEDAAAVVNASVQRRIKVSNDGREFEFVQGLLDVNNGLLYGYRNVSRVAPDEGYKPVTWWYSPYTNKLKGWDGKAWTDHILVTVSSGIYATRVPVVSAEEPTHLNNVEYALWYNPNTNDLYYRNIIGNSWNIEGTVDVGADPSLQTIWKPGTNNEQFIPQYVDKNKEPISVGHPDGDWQLPNQWAYNVEHRNYSNVKWSELVTHFTSILDQQVSLPGFLSGGRFALTQDSYNYGLGGTIRDHNDSFDTLISAVNVNNVTPVGVIEFAQNEYATGLLTIRGMFSNAIIELFSKVSPESLTNFVGEIVDGVVKRYETNEFFNQLYGDTSAYNATTNKGIKNWIATSPMFGLSQLYVPHIVDGGTFLELFHHDGHRSPVVFTAPEEDKYSRSIINQLDARTEHGKLGVLSSSAPPATVTSYNATFFPSNPFAEIQPGVYWYRNGGGHRELYRLECYAVSDYTPVSNPYIKTGSMYYNILSQSTFQYNGTNWIEITVPGAEDISPMWTVVNFNIILAQVYLAIEQMLYEVTPTYPALSFDYSTLLTVDNLTTYRKLKQQRFDAYVISHNIVAPMVNNTYHATNPFSWNYAASILDTRPHAIGVVEQAACWQEIYTRWFGTPYPHLEPWCLQGYKSKPAWWDEEYADTTGTRRWIYNHALAVGMWENIRVGIVPSGRPYPNGKISTGNPTSDGVFLTTYQYFCVNISDSTIPGGYEPDAVLPPFYDSTSIEITLPTVRSLFTRFSSQVISPNADYVFGDGGPIEWQWSTSIQSAYDNAIIAFLMEPAKFLHSTFGPTFVNVDGLQVETTFKKVYSHKEVLFHGDLYNTNQSYEIRGLNQWYVNFNRFTGFDTNQQFREEWAGWSPKLTYQFGGIVDTESLDISNKFIDVNSQDYNILLVNNGVIQDVWVDAFEISILSMPPAIIQYNNQGLWKFELNTLAPIARKLPFYGVKSYVAKSDYDTNLIHVLRYSIIGMAASSKVIYVAGDQTRVLIANRQFEISGSSHSNGTYTIQSSLYEPTLDRTRLVVIQPFTFSTTLGVLSVLNVEIDWQTGDQVVVSSTKILPAPLVPSTPYYVIKTATNTYKIAETYNDAISNIPIEFTSGGDGIISLSEIKSSFQIFGGHGHSPEIWFHYAIDYNDLQGIAPPTTIQGMQQLINIIDGYVEYQLQQNVLYGVHESGEFDPDTGRTVDWQIEIERFIEWAYGLRASQVKISDKYPIAVNATTNTFTFVDSVPLWTSGTQVSVNTTGTLPSPLVGNALYYYHPTDVPGSFKLSITPSTIDPLNVIDILTPGSGSIHIGTYNRQNVYPSFEINPCRNNIWILTPLGVLSNVVEGPYADVRVQQTIFDQYGRPLSSDKLLGYREDGRTRIAIRPQIQNDLDLAYVNDPYNYIHLGGAHLFVEGYEHFLIFNDYTASNDLLFDSFVGLNIGKFTLDYYEKAEYTLRPTLGGFYLNDNVFKRNMEGSITDIKTYYDANQMGRNSETAKRGRAIIGFDGPSEYLDLLNINLKSQFMFHRGVLQSKGSVNSVKAYINSRRFIDAKLDEFWAWKIAEYGDYRERVYPEIKVYATDGIIDDIRFLFLAQNELETDADAASDIKQGFHPISFTNSERWVDFPEQRDLLKSPLFLDAEVSSFSSVYSGKVAPLKADVLANNITHWYNGETVKQLVNNEWVIVPDKIHIKGSTLFWKHDSITDATRVVRRILQTHTNNFNIISVNNGLPSVTVAGNVGYSFISGEQFQIVGSGDYDGVYTVSETIFDGVNTIVIVKEQLTGTTIGSGIVSIVIREFGNYINTTINEGSPGNDGFMRVNSEVISFNASAFVDIILIFAINAAKSRISPAKLIDKKSRTVVQDIPLWHPAIGYHSTIAAHNIDYFVNGDPARYSVTLIPGAVSNLPWNSNEQGTIWLDTSLQLYKPYYDTVIYPQINDRLYRWGDMLDVGRYAVYKWVSSTTSPEQWDQQVVSDASNGSLSQNDKKTGTPRKTMFKRFRSSYPVLEVSLENKTIKVNGSNYVDGDTIIIGSTKSVPGGIISSEKYLVHNVTNVPGYVASCYVATGYVFDNVQTFQLIDPETSQVVTITSQGEGDINVTVPFAPTDWVRYPVISERIYCAMIDCAFTDPTFLLKDTRWIANDPISIYKNGEWVLDTTVSDGGCSYGTHFVDTTGSGLTVTNSDFITVVRPIHIITDEEVNFDPDTQDDATKLEQWRNEYEYTITSVSPGSLITGLKPTTYYHFWVEHSTNKVANKQDSISIYAISKQLAVPPGPHFVVQKPLDDSAEIERIGFGAVKFGNKYDQTAIGNHYYVPPVMYRQAIIRNAASYINDDNRYVIRFLRDLTLRDKLIPNDYYAANKNKHEEWFIFRQNQPNAVPRELWDKLTESVMGQSQISTVTLGYLNQGIGYTDGLYSNIRMEGGTGYGLIANITVVAGVVVEVVVLDGGTGYTVGDILTSSLPGGYGFTISVTNVSTVRVPSLERELYDATNGTDTRFGLGEGQAFMDKNMGINTIVKYLVNPNNNLYPVDIDEFFSRNSFTTPASIKASMNEIYTAFPSEHVNAIWFEALYDAFSTKSKYKELFKTSWIALHGIRILEVGGMFDD